MHKLCTSFQIGNKYRCLKCSVPKEVQWYSSEEDFLEDDFESDSDGTAGTDGTDGPFHPDIEDLCSDSSSDEDERQR